VLSFNDDITLYCKVHDITCLKDDIPGFDWCLAVDLLNKSTLFCFYVTLVMQFSKVHDVRYYSNDNLLMLELIEWKAYSALVPIIQGQRMLSVGTEFNGLLLLTWLLYRRLRFLEQFADGICKGN